jgi:hypothetical protein
LPVAVAAVVLDLPLVPAALDITLLLQEPPQQVEPALLDTAVLVMEATVVI